MKMIDATRLTAPASTFFVALSRLQVVADHHAEDADEDDSPARRRK